MKKPLVTILVILVCLTLIVVLVLGARYLIRSLLAQSVTPQDWRVPLPGGYEIQRLNSQEIILVKPDTKVSSTIVIESYINAYCYDQRYIGLWCAKDGPNDLLGIAPEADAFYLVDSLDDTICGPLNSTAYQALCTDLCLTEFDRWTRTAPKVPPDAVQ